MITPPQEKTGFPKMQNPEVEEARRQVTAMMKETGITPAQLKDIGSAAELAIYNKQMYPMFIQKARQYGFAEEGDFQGNVDYQALALFSALAKLV